MINFEKYLYKDVEITCGDKKTFKGTVDSFGGSIQGEEEYAREEPFVSVYTGDGDYVLFESEIMDIKEL